MLLRVARPEWPEVAAASPADAVHHGLNRNDHETRIEMVAAGPDTNCDKFYRVATATVAHALCDRDGVPAPQWIPRCILDEDSIVVPSVSPDGRLIRENASPICRIHRLYFESDWLAAT